MMKIWKRNAVVATVVLFVCVALYLSWVSTRVQDEEGDILDPYSVYAGTTEPGVLESESGIVESGDIESGLAPEYLSESGGTEAEYGESGYFAEARLSRQRARDAAINILSDAMGLEAATQEAKDNAYAGIEVMAQNALTEARIESLVISKGFSDCVAYISDEGVNLVVTAPVGGLNNTDIIKITDIVTDETGFTAEELKIITAK